MMNFSKWKLFYLLTGESRTSFFLDAIVPVTVVGLPRPEQRKNFILVRLDNGLTGSIYEDRVPQNVVLQESAMLEACVTNVRIWGIMWVFFWGIVLVFGDL